MRWTRRAVVVGGVVVAVLAGAAAPAGASTNLGWLYTVNNGGAIFFDADLNGQPGIEKITVCDNKSDGRGIAASVEDVEGNLEYFIVDRSHDGSCTVYQGDLFKEETRVSVSVWEYAGTWKSSVKYGIAVA
jgi:hypothetical protein